MDESTEKGKKSLEVRLSEIEDKLNELLGVGKRETKASEEDIQTYKKVLRAALDDQAACGINECSKCIVTHCDRCINVCTVCRVCDRCIVTCSVCTVCKVCDRCITECRVCDRCITECRVCDRCITECSCGPCTIDPIGGGEFSRGGTNRSRKRIGEFESLG